MGKPRKLTKHTMPRHVRALRKQCGHMAHAYNVGGMPPARDREGGFRTLLRIISDPQNCVHAGAAIWIEPLHCKIGSTMWAGKSTTACKRFHRVCKRRLSTIRTGY